MTNLGGIAIGIAIVAIAISGVAIMLNQNQDAAQTTTITPTERTIYMNLVEPKGTTNVSKEPFPTVPLPEGGGFELVPPNDAGDWTVETYSFSPSLVVVNQGDTVNLKMLGLNGALHHVSIENYAEPFDVHRGELHEVSFVADKAGTFKIFCSIHQPAMTGYLMVIPNE
ncbi:MAG TPA: cupredoxin domain-containing protein [Candidatus Nitrosotenuis sp.]|nr:cupredoxin domain-containing protein [Candidatus Nitrosotenuis sp.]